MSFDFTFEKRHLRAMIGNNPYLDYWHNTICKILPEYEINTKYRVAGFIAQCSHESTNFTALRENLNYRAVSLRNTFGKYFTSDEMAKQFANKPEKIANKVYADRMGNGDEASGDGYRYLGRGLIQLTGKNTYMLFAASINVPVEEVPDYLGTFEGAVQSACWFWEQNNLNAVADNQDIVKMTKIINGGTHGLDDRILRYKNALKILGA